jgi:hypothetical protein
MAKSKFKLLARGMRREGMSIKEISKKLSVSVGSVSMWCKDIELTEEQILNLQKRRTDPYYGKKREYLESKQKELKEKIQKIKLNSIIEIGQLSHRELLIAGTALYWGEGFKKDHQVGLATTDVLAAKFYILWLKVCFGIKNEDLLIRLTINLTFKNEEKRIQEYWAEKLNLDLKKFSKTFFQKSTWKKEYENKDAYNGVIRIRVRKSMDLLRRIQGYIEGVAQNVNGVTLQKPLPTVCKQVEELG